MGVRLDVDDEAFAEAAFKHFPLQREALRALEWRYNQLPGRPPLPEPLVRLGKALEECARHRSTDRIVAEIRRQLEALHEGIELLRMLAGELTGEAVKAVEEATSVQNHQLAQLADAGELGGVESEAAAIREALSSDRPWRGIHELEGPFARAREQYTDVRRRLLAQQGAVVEEAQRRIRMLAGFERLSPEQAHRVLKPLQDVLVDTTVEAVWPSLLALRDGFAGRIAPAEEQARDRLDEERNQAVEGAAAKVVKLEVHLRGREIGSRDQMRAVFRELEERIGPVLDRGDKVRLW